MEQAGGFECIGSCEIDRYAAAAYRAMYNTEKEVFYDDITGIDTAGMVNCSAYLICYLRQHSGGTFYTVNYAERKGLEILRL